MNETMIFSDRHDLRAWLGENCLSSDGIWILFGKVGGPKTVKPDEALEEALCFGWIDGQMQSVDDKTYKKYFSPRRKNSKWSEKNKALAQRLEKSSMMTEYGKAKIAEAKQNGQWGAQHTTVTEEDVERLAAVLSAYELAYANFIAMPPSVKKTYARAYFDAKTDDGRKKRVEWMVGRLEKNLRPM